ncbi:hypothetical protein GOP47_0004105 [Adiantum capillus-veneris]|uniref:Uncharacterized protein n=1 Tax=Adiantum capillus-veneris TaxID=13818 RepID=A0A9D4V8M9_ADICA|nr:hypothetical protein GOP47_0004105 [Adiantum capillus-veneris]
MWFKCHSLTISTQEFRTQELIRGLGFLRVRSIKSNGAACGFERKRKGRQRGRLEEQLDQSYEGVVHLVHEEGQERASTYTTHSDLIPSAFAEAYHVVGNSVRTFLIALGFI